MLTDNEGKPKSKFFSFDLNPTDLAGIFMSKGWRYDRFQRPVLPKDIQDMIERSVNALVRTGKGYAELGRFIVFRDSEFPGGYEIALKIGYVAVTDPNVDPDAPCDDDCDCLDDDE